MGEGNAARIAAPSQFPTPIAMRVYRDEDADLAIIRGRKVAVLGYGNQGRAQALNLRDSGVAALVTGVREAAPSRAAAGADGFEIMTLGAASEWADLVM